MNPAQCGVAGVTFKTYLRGITFKQAGIVGAMGVVTGVALTFSKGLVGILKGLLLVFVMAIITLRARFLL